MSSPFPAEPKTRALVAAFVVRDFAIARSYRLPFVLDTAFGLLQLVVYFFVSETFADVGTDQLDGAPTYFAFAAVGIIVALIIEAAIQGVAESLRAGQLTGSLEALLTQPISNAQLCLGFTSFPFAFAVVRALIYLIVAALVLDLDLAGTDWLGLVVMFTTTCFAIASIGMLAGAALIVFKRGDALTGILVFAMTLITGAVFPVSALPDWLATIGSVLPLRLSFDGTRSALFEGSGWESDAVGLAAFAIVSLPLALWVFSRALSAARRAGSLGEY